MGKVIEVSDETYDKIKEQLGEESFKDIDSLKDMVGEKYWVKDLE